MAESWDGLVVLCAANSWDDTKRVDQHMAERLTAHAPVLYVDPPVSHLTRFNKPAVADSLKRPRLRVLGPRLARLTPIVPPKPAHPAIQGIAARLTRRQLRAAVAQLGGSVDAVVTTWLFTDAYGVCGERRRVYWWQDDPIGAADALGRQRRAARGGRATAGRRLGPDRGGERGRRGALDRARTRHLVPPERLRRRVLRDGRGGGDAARRRARRSDRRVHRAPQQPDRPRPAGSGRGARDLAAADRLAGSRLRARALRAPRGAPQRQPPRRAAVRVAPVVPQGDRRRARAVRRHRVQQVQLPAEDLGVPRGGPSRGRDLAAGDPLARHGSRDARRHAVRVRGVGRARTRRSRACPSSSRGAADSPASTAGGSAPRACPSCSPRPPERR